MLEPQIRDTLENIIDQWVQAFPDRIRSARKDTRWAPNVQNEADYALGYTHGAIRASFIAAFALSYKRDPNEEEMQEADNIIFRSNGDFKDAILESGKNL